MATVDIFTASAVPTNVGFVSVATDSHIQITSLDGSVVQNYYGFGIFYDEVAGTVEGGTITGTDLFINGIEQYDITGLLHSAQQVAALVLAGDAGGLRAYLFNDADTFNGSAFDDLLGGHDGNDTLHGNGGDDLIDGGAGSDSMLGGTGNDTYFVDAGFFSGTDVVVELAGEGYDTVESLRTFTLGEHVEVLVLRGGNIDGTGNPQANVIIGTLGANVLDGRGGADTLQGSLGDDVYVADLEDTLVEDPGQGSDTVRASVSFSLVGHDNIENIELTGVEGLTATGSGGANLLTGNDGANVLDGGAGDDTLQGGAGADTLRGSLGDDVYVLADAAQDTLVEAAGEGRDTVRASVSFSLEALAEIEDVELQGTADIDAAGSAIANLMLGNAGANVLSGGGGEDTLDGSLGDDTLQGGSGHDTYVVADLADRLVEAAGEGSDTVRAGVSFSLAGLADIENIELTGSGDLSATGNGGANRLAGNPGANALDGGTGDDTLVAGTGVDTVTGGLGDDHFIVDDDDVVVELAGGGSDTIEIGSLPNAPLAYTLAPELENLLLTGSFNLRGTGNSAANVLTGNAGDNSLDGAGGADTLAGAAGDDTYFVDAAGDAVLELAGQGTDEVRSAVSYVLGEALEHLRLTGFANIDATGNAGGNVIFGNVGNNRLDGAGGADNMQGGLGDDLYIVDHAGDTVDELLDHGNDTIESAVSYSLADTALPAIEVLVLTGAAAIDATGAHTRDRLVGNDAQNVLSGQGGDDTLLGGAGNDTLDGGSGADSMAGGAGDDAYVVSDNFEAIVENGGEGVDRVTSSAFLFRLPDNVENLVLVGTAVIGAGNALDNAITGNAENNPMSGHAGNDSLVGGAGNDDLEAGEGADTMVGGPGNDTYYVSEAGDVVVEANGEGIDTLKTVFGASLADTPALENLTLLDAGGAINGSGTALANVIVGNVAANALSGAGGNDTLDGGGASDTLAGGAGNDSLVGGAGDDTLNGGAGDDTMLGGLGADTIIVDSTADVLSGAFATGTDKILASVSYSIADYDNVANLTLTGSGDLNATGNGYANSITGNAGANQLSGGGHNDTLDGGAGADTLTGGQGNDTYFIDASDVVVEGADFGSIDSVFAGFSFVVPENVENGALGAGAFSITGNAANNTLQGNDGANALDGATGHDTLNGAGGDDTLTGGLGDDFLDGGAGADWLAGGAGGDAYFVDAHDVFFEAAGEGDDSVFVLASHVLGENFENLQLNGIGNINGTGNAAANWLFGNGGNNLLTGLGGADTMFGGFGNDTFVIDASDLIFDAFGIDTVRAGFSYTLAPDFENLVLTGAAAIDGTGSSYANHITGNGAANVLDGGADGNDTLLGAGGQDTLSGGAGDDILDGGAGEDSMSGGAGNDLYVVDSLADIANELGGSGVDEVQSSVRYTLTAGVERLTLTGTSGVSATGNGLNNVLTGNSGNNTLNGNAGDDTMVGGAGNDTYIVNAADQVTENSGEGTDRVSASVNYALGDHVEQLTLTGANPISGTGNGVANTIKGNGAGNAIEGGGGNDLLYGLGGADSLIGGDGGDALRGGTGQDTLTGGAGRDSFFFLEGGEVDFVTDFQTGLDKLRLDNAIYTQAGAVGSFAAGDARFASGSGMFVAQDADDRIIYNTASGDLYYDADGAGGADATLFATLIGAPTVVATDIAVI